MAGQVPKQVVQERYERLVALQDEISWDEAKRLVGSDVDVLVSAHDGRKDGATGRVSGRALDGRLVHAAMGELDVQPGDLITTTVTRAAPHHLIADGMPHMHRAWRGRTTAAATPSTRPLLQIGSVSSGGSCG